MAQTFKWVAPEAIVTYFTTELDSQTTNTQVDGSTVIDNATDLYQFINFEVVLASLTPAVGGFISIIAVPAIDGTNYLDSNVNFLDVIIATIGLRNNAAAVRAGKTMVPIGPFKYKLSLYQNAGVSFAASGNTLKYARNNGQAV